MLKRRQGLIGAHLHGPLCMQAFLFVSPPQPTLRAQATELSPCSIPCQHGWGMHSTQVLLSASLTHQLVITERQVSHLAPVHGHDIKAPLRLPAVYSQEILAAGIQAAAIRVKEHTPEAEREKSVCGTAKTREESKPISSATYQILCMLKKSPQPNNSLCWIWALTGNHARAFQVGEPSGTKVWIPKQGYVITPLDNPHCLTELTFT